ncbi:MAG: diacylglycerol kinase family lipid kinase [Lachnospiraceae bacterium]|nr:diacylglycerol kinase family lipid kinase [Lachnospiraceae bacterium]
MPKKYYFIVNASGGSGRAARRWKKIKHILDSKKVDYEVLKTEKAGDARRCADALTAVRSDELNLVIVGGDGTINEVLNGIRNFSLVRLAVIPSGSGNDFARSLHLCTKPEAALERILKSDTIREVDLGSVSIPGNENHLFGISAGLGLDAIVCKKALTSRQKRWLNALNLGSLIYLLLTIETWFSMQPFRMKVRTSGRETKNISRAVFLAGMNGRQEGGGVPMAPKASCTDGKLSFVTAHHLAKWKAFYVLPLLIMGRHTSLRYFDFQDAESIDILTDVPMVVHADGEYVGSSDKIRMTCLPGRLRLMQ